MTGEDRRWKTVGQLELEGPGGEPVDLTRTLASHGVATLAPQEVDPVAGTLLTTVRLGDGTPATVRVRRSGSSRARIHAVSRTLDAGGRRELLGIARVIFGLDDDLSPFYAIAADDPELAWATGGAGRMLRGPTVFEDVVKTIATTNCSWSATERMVTTMVEQLGIAALDGRRAFPSPEAMAAAGVSFYREVVRAGYRSPYLEQVAALVAGGSVDLEGLRDGDLPDAEVTRRLLALPGIGPYGAAHIQLVSLGRYRLLVLDSWTRPTYARLSGRRADDRAIERRFRRYGDYAGLAFWLYLTRGWVDPTATPVG